MRPFYLLTFLIWAVSCSGLLGQERLELRLPPGSPGAQLSWSSIVPRISGASSEYVVQHSQDLVRWTDASAPISSGTPELLSALIPTTNNSGFHRIVRSLKLSAPRDEGAEVFGYSGAFSRELSKLGALSIPQFSARFPAPSGYAPGISWDPTTAQYWSEFNADPAAYNKQLPPGSTSQRLYDFRLNENELAIFKTNGFVVSERLATRSFAELYYEIFVDDLPVFVTTDSVLQAWHRSYDAMLTDLEESFLHAALDRLLEGMAAQVPAIATLYTQPVLLKPIEDADYFLAVARSLLRGTNVPTFLNQDTRVQATLGAVSAEQAQTFELFGHCRDVDFSQFKARGHYEDSERLKQYFRAILWVGRIDLRVAATGANDGCPTGDTLRELASAIVLHRLLLNSGQTNTWAQIDQVIRVFVGEADSMNFAQLGATLRAANVFDLAELRDEASLLKVQETILSGEAGAQAIRGDLFFSPMGPENIKLPRSFCFLGQRFVPDSWALSQVVFDSIFWDSNGDGEGEKVPRRFPSGLDVAFSTLGNDAVVPDIIARLDNKEGHPFRDGLPYQHNLAAARLVIDGQGAKSWKENIYMGWLGALRTLSAPTTAPAFPEVMRTRSWAMKNVNTQLASWTQLRHDTVLYAKQSYSGGVLCSYPFGYVEPNPAFWGWMSALANRAGDLIQTLSFEGQANLQGKMIDLRSIQSNQVQFLRFYANTMDTLGGIALKELQQQPLDTNEVTFLKDIVEVEKNYDGRRYSGWYPHLFYRSYKYFDTKWEDIKFHAEAGCGRWDALVTDVHTIAPWVGLDDGFVLHQAVGLVNCLMIAIDNGPDKMVFAGPVLSHFEFKTDGLVRKTDTQWREEAMATSVPRPEWTRSYLAPAARFYPKIPLQP